MEDKQMSDEMTVKDEAMNASENNKENVLDQYEAAVKKAGGREAMAERLGDVTIKLKKPLVYGKDTITEIHMDFLSLTGLDMEIIDDQIGALGLRGLLPAYSRRYQRMLAARAADVPEDLILRLPLADYNAVVGAAQNFLLVTG